MQRHSPPKINLFSEAISSYIYCQDTLHEGMQQLKRPVAQLRHPGPNIFIFGSFYQRALRTCLLWAVFVRNMFMFCSFIMVSNVGYGQVFVRFKTKRSFDKHLSQLV